MSVHKIRPMSEKRGLSTVSFSLSRTSNAYTSRLSILDRKQLSSSLLHRKGIISAEVKFSADYNGCYCMKYSPEEDVFAASFGTGCVQVRNANDCELMGVLRPAGEKEPAMTSLRFHTNDSGLVFAAGLQGNIFLMKKKALTSTLFAQESNEINAIDINSAGDFLATGGKDSVIRIYDLHTKKLVQKLGKGETSDGDYHKMRIFAIKCEPDNPQIFYSGGWDNCVKVWDARTRAGCIQSINGPHICGDGIDIKDTSILTASWTMADSLKVYDTRKGDLIETIRPINKQESIEGEFYYTCRFYKGNPTGDIVLAGGSGTGSVDIIQRSTSKLKLRFKTNKTVLTIDTKDQGCIFGGMGNVLKGAILAANLD